MKTAIWIIAICSVVRIIQNGIQLSMLIGEKEMRKSLNNEFIDSLKKNNQEWAKELLKDFLANSRDLTDEERAAVSDYIESKSVHTGVNIWDFYGREERSEP